MLLKTDRAWDWKREDWCSKGIGLLVYRVFQKAHFWQKGRVDGKSFAGLFLHRFFPYQDLFVQWCPFLKKEKLDMEYSWGSELLQLYRCYLLIHSEQKRPSDGKADLDSQWQGRVDLLQTHGPIE